MIKLVNWKRTNIPFEISRFPDKTSQVWHVQETPRPDVQSYAILWNFENEAELFHVCQLAQLCREHFKTHVQLICPYLPYGRQDKCITNDSTFAKSTFLTVLKSVGITAIYTFDAHSINHEYMPIVSMKPTKFLESVYNHDLVCYPDKGAQDRYSKFFTKPSIAAEKVRNQQSGNIEGLNLLANDPSTQIKDRKILIVDDICDGGATFIRLMEKLNEYKPAQVDLAVSHGLFTKGKDVLFKAGIKNIYTTNTIPQYFDKSFDAVGLFFEKE